MDKVIFGDNQFFGVNHMSEQKAIQQAQRFRTTQDIYDVLNYVNSIGIKSFMFTTHHQLEPVLEMMKREPSFSEFKLIPCMPYAHKYADAMVELGIFEAIDKLVLGNKFVAGMKGVVSMVTANPVPVMKMLVDFEMKLLKGWQVEAVFLLNIVTDFLLGLGMEFMLAEFAIYVEKKYGVKAGFFTMNYVGLHAALVDRLQLDRPLICSCINKVGFRMNPDKSQVERVVAEERATTIAMSILASGAVHPREAVKYISELNGVESMLFGASSPGHILETKKLIDELM
jgi:hypothetical protein